MVRYIHTEFVRKIRKEGMIYKRHKQENGFKIYLILTVMSFAGDVFCMRYCRSRFCLLTREKYSRKRSGSNLKVPTRFLLSRVALLNRGMYKRTFISFEVV